MAQIIQSTVNLTSQIGISDRLTLKPGSEKERFQIIRPFPKSLYEGPLESIVAPTIIGGTWYPKAKARRDIIPNGSVILHIHGGAFVTGDGRSASLGFLANTLVKHAGTDAVFAPQYRLSGYGRTNPFPAGLQDILTSYLYLLRTLDIPSRNIALSGDSAGGNLAIAFLRYLSEYGKRLDIPSPQCAVLISPWVSPLNHLGNDLTFTSNPNYPTDFLPPEFTRWGARTYSAITPANDPYITALGSPFATSVPIFVTQGAAEVLEIDGTHWVKEMSQVGGNKIESHYETAAPHDTLLVGESSGWRDSAEDVASKIGNFIKASQNTADINFQNVPGKL